MQECLIKGINRTILECKYDKISIFGSNIRVLIELYWNVNKSKKKKSTTPASVLIELYWNVNRWRKQRMC